MLAKITPINTSTKNTMPMAKPDWRWRLAEQKEESRIAYLNNKKLRLMEL
jgi:hypothetical protein